MWNKLSYGTLLVLLKVKERSITRYIQFNIIQFINQFGQEPRRLQLLFQEQE